MNTVQVTQFAERTSDAYSFDRYGLKNWLACIRMMDKMGFNQREIEAVLRSKWMRWAGDNSNHDYGNCNQSDLRKFFNTMSDLPKQVKDLAHETFAYSTEAK